MAINVKVTCDEPIINVKVTCDEAIITALNRVADAFLVKPKVKKAKKEEPVAVVEPEEPVVEAEVPKELVEEPKTILSGDEIFEIAKVKGDTKEKRLKIRAIMDELGITSIKDVPEEKKAGFLARLEEI